MADQPQAVMVVLVDKKGFTKHLVLAVQQAQEILKLPVKLEGEPERVLLFQRANIVDQVVVYLEIGEQPRLIELVTGINHL